VCAAVWLGPIRACGDLPRLFQRSQKIFMPFGKI